RAVRVDLHPVEAVEEEQQSERYEDGAAGDREGAEVVAQPPERRHSAREEQPDRQKREPEADGVRGEERRAAHDGGRAACERERPAEQRTDARRGTDGE